MLKEQLIVECPSPVDALSTTLCVLHWCIRKNCATGKDEKTKGPRGPYICYKIVC